MKLGDLAELAGRNLREALLRNALTTLGIAVGVASLVAMLSLGVGLQEVASKRLVRAGQFDKIFVLSGPGFRGFGDGPRPPMKTGSATGENRPLDENARQRIARLPDVLEVYPTVQFTGDVRYAGRTTFVRVSGVPPSDRTSENFENIRGAFFSGLSAEEVILPVEFARRLTNAANEQPGAMLGRVLVLRYPERRALASPKSGQRNAPEVAQGGAGVDPDFGIGFSVALREKQLRVVGILEPLPPAGPNAPGRILIPLQLAESLNVVKAGDLSDVTRAPGEVSMYQSLTVRVSSPLQVAPAEDAINQMGYTTISPMDNARSLRRFFAILDMFLGIFGSLALAVASLGIINTLVMAILERRREIGILKALGAGDRDIRQLFFAEAGAMGLLGGVLGVALGWAIGRAIHFGTTIYLRRHEMTGENVWSVPWWLVVGAVGFALLVSLAAGIYPAARAARLNPVEALRYE